MLCSSDHAAPPESKIDESMFGLNAAIAPSTCTPLPPSIAGLDFTPKACIPFALPIITLLSRVISTSTPLSTNGVPEVVTPGAPSVRY